MYIICSFDPFNHAYTEYNRRKYGEEIIRRVDIPGSPTLVDYTFKVRKTGEIFQCKAQCLRACRIKRKAALGF